MLVLSQDLSRNWHVEAKEHIKRFHELFFTRLARQGWNESNIKRTLFLSDKIALSYYCDWLEKGYFNHIISGNINQDIQVDNVICNFDTYSYKIITYAWQMFICESNVSERSEVWLQSVSCWTPCEARIILRG